MPLAIGFRSCAIFGLTVTVAAICSLPPSLKAQGGAPAIVQPAAPEAVSLEGTVREVFLNRFILESGRGRYLVEPTVAAAAFWLAADDRVTVTGRRFGPVVQAQRIVRANGEVIHDSTTAPSAAVDPPPATTAPGAQNSPATLRSIPDALAALGLQPLGEAVRRRHHTEILARMKDGRSVYVSFDLDDRLWEIEDADYDSDRVKQPSPPPEAELFRRIGEAGFTPLAVQDRRRRHLVVAARNRDGETIDLHVDFAGYVYKQVWPRSRHGGGHGRYRRYE